MRYLDDAGIRRAVVLSDAYYFDSPKLSANSVEKVRAENDWTAQQVASFPDRLVAFCSFNPLNDHALAELERCAASGRFAGIKLHFGMSNVYFDIAEIALVVGNSDEMARSVVALMRHTGMSRMLYGSDGPVADSMAPADAWKAVPKLPLADQELATLAANVAPYLSSSTR